MNKNYTSLFLSLLLCAPMVTEAQNPLCTKESKYNASNILTSEVHYHYQQDNVRNISRNELDQRVSLKKFNDEGKLIQEDNRNYDEWENKWYISNRQTYTYNPSGKVESRTSYLAAWDGTLNVSDYTEYEYNDQGFLIREIQYKTDEKLRVSNDREYLDFNEGGKPTRMNLYRHQDGNITLYGYTEYLYNNRFDLLLQNVYEEDLLTSNIKLSKKYSWSYNEQDLLEQYLSFEVGNENQLMNKDRIDYAYEPGMDIVASETRYYWVWSTESWNKSVILRYSYSEELAPEKAPRNLAVNIEEDNLLTWDAPVEQSNLTGYNVYNGIELVATLDAATRSFVPEITAEGIAPWFVTSVYGNNEGNSSSYVDIEYVNTDVYPTPTFGGVSSVRELEYGNLQFDVYWSAPETDLEVKGYHIFFNHWPQNDNPVSETSYTFTIMRYDETATFGVSAVYAGGAESEEDYREYNINDLATSIINSSKGRDIWSFGGNICIDGSEIRAVEIYDASGMKVAQQSLKEGIHTIRLPKAVYIVKAVTEKGVQSMKLFNE